MRAGLADVISSHSSQLATLKLYQYQSVHTEAKVLLLFQNGTVGSDWSAF